MLICYKKWHPNEQLDNKITIFATSNIIGGLLMSTKNEVKEENMKVDRQLVEPSAPKQLPSIWYT